MSSNEQINFRYAQNQENQRPLSTDDNLNTNNSGANDANLNTSSPETESDGNQQTNKNSNEFPFSGISFRFDELKQLQQNIASAHASNGCDNVDVNNYKSHQSNLNNNHISNNPNKQFVDSINGNSQMRNNQGHTVTTIAQNHSSTLPSSSGSSSSSLQYENTGIIRSASKPVHSAAKSQFFGLHKSNDTGDGINRSDTTSNENTGESSTVSDEEPLLNHFQNKAIAATSSSQYQNVPGNSAFYDQNKILSVNNCTCKDFGGVNEIQQYDSEQNKCNSCLRSNAVNESMIGVPNSNNEIATCSTSEQITLDASTSYRMSQSLSQAVYMSTTVPQNIKVRRRNPLGIRHQITVKYLYCLHVLAGLGVSGLGLWLCWWAPSTRAKENPYWSGLILMLSGILGIILIAFRPIPRQKLRQHFIAFLRVNSTFVTLIAAICSLLASSFAVMHLVKILSPVTECRPVNILVDSSSCTCSFEKIVRNETVHQTVPKTDGEILSGIYYRDLNCNEVMGPFKYILIASAVLNAIGFVLCCTLLVMLCMRHKPVKRVPYSTANSRHRL